MHFCRTVAGGKYGLNWRAMLADIEPQVFEEWIALYELEPWGADWQQASLLAHMLSSGDGASDRFIQNIDNQKSMEVDDSQLAARWQQRLGM